MRRPSPDPRRPRGVMGSPRPLARTLTRRAQCCDDGGSDDAEKPEAQAKGQFPKCAVPAVRIKTLAGASALLLTASRSPSIRSGTDAAGRGCGSRARSGQASLASRLPVVSSSVRHRLEKKTEDFHATDRVGASVIPNQPSIIMRRATTGVQPQTGKEHDRGTGTRHPG